MTKAAQKAEKPGRMSLARAILHALLQAIQEDDDIGFALAIETFSTWLDGSGDIPKRSDLNDLCSHFIFDTVDEVWGDLLQRVADATAHTMPPETALLDIQNMLKEYSVYPDPNPGTS